MFKNKFLILSLLVMICCISVASAADIDNTDNISDDIEVDEVTEVDDVDVGDTQDNVADDGNLRGNSVVLDTTNYAGYFDANGFFNDSTVTDVTFDDAFGSQSYGNFKFNQSVTINATQGSTFTDVGFDLLADGITLNGVTITITAPNATDCYAINIANSDNSVVSNNTITYVCSYENAANYNYVIKAVDSENLTIEGNNITATVPLKTVAWSYGIGADYVLGVGIQNCPNVSFKRNNLSLTANARVGSFPTLDAVMIVGCNGAYVGNNSITVIDVKSKKTEYSYIYGIDVYSCNNITINNNTVRMNADRSGGQIGGNGTGAAYCIQLTGPHTGVLISNNTLTTKNNGPNLGIYSQNYYGTTELVIVNNTIDVTGTAGTNEWALVSGMELQDTNATVYNNTITVTNNEGHNLNACIYGISYSQQTSGNHTFNITNNTVKVVDGNYSVYIADAINSYIYNNTLVADINKSGDSCVYLDTNDTNKNNHNYNNS